MREVYSGETYMTRFALKPDHGPTLPRNTLLEILGVLQEGNGWTIRAATPTGRRVSVEYHKFLFHVN